MKKTWTILGIDPGTHTTGYGIIKTDAHTNVVVDYGYIRLPRALSLYERYPIIYQSIKHLLTTFPSIDAVSIESQFVSKNAQSTLKLGMAKGVAILAAAEQKISIYEYTPKKAKLAVAGRGSASKDYVRRMVPLVLQIETLLTSEDVADALALAICHAHHIKIAGQGV